MSATDAAIAAIADRQHGRVAAAQLVAAGVSRTAIKRRVSDGRLRRVHRGVYAVGHDQRTLRGSWMAAVLALGPGALLGRRDAAALRDLRAAGSRSRVDVLVPGTSRHRRRGIAVYATSTLHPDDRDEVDGIPVTSAERTIVDLADVLPERGLQRVLARAERLRAIDHAKLQAVIARNPGRRGLRVLLPLLAQDHTLGAAAESELERRFFDLIRDHGLPDPVAGASVCGYVVDAYWPDARLVVELQGYEFHSDRETFERDHVKLATLRRYGIELLPLTYRQVTADGAQTAGLLRKLLRSQPLTRAPAAS